MFMAKRKIKINKKEGKVWYTIGEILAKYAESPTNSLLITY